MGNVAASVKALKIGLGKVKDDALLVGFFKEKLGLSPELKKLDSQFGNVISSCIKTSGFKAEKGEFKNIYVNKNIINISRADTDCTN